MVAYPTTEPRRLTPQEYLERERHAETKSEYHGGVLMARAGASPEHNAIVFDIIGTLSVQLKGKPCQGFPSDLRVRVPACNKYYYPYVIVTCEEPRYEMLAGMRSLLNPTLIVEVLSDSTLQADKGEKWLCYQTLDSLQTYVLVSHQSPVVEAYSRQANGWLYTAVVGLESAVPLESIGCTLRLADIYARVPFPPAAEPGKNGAESTTEKPDLGNNS
ncbi:MAG TPA: Uma2 family endonuclease [Chthonomonadaceae bacterium]|nr:Uma2 family endonuclease [Chthonomonadaceae bacterium]